MSIDSVVKYTVVAREESGKIMVERDFPLADFPDALEQAKSVYWTLRQEHGDGKTVHGGLRVTLLEYKKRPPRLFRVMSAEEIGQLITTETSK